MPKGSTERADVFIDPSRANESLLRFTTGNGSTDGDLAARAK
jgi:predicted transcriptional regulator